MIYWTYNKNKLIWEKNIKKTFLFWFSAFLLIITSFVFGRYQRINSIDEYEQEIILINLEKERNKFTEEKFINELKLLNVKYPHIVMAQSIIETGNFKSKIFRENNNLFGMKEAQRRISTSEGTNNNHAYYENWKMSVYDYAFYQCRYLSNIKSEQDYYNYLGVSYAESTTYVETIRNTVEKHKLKELFK